LLECRGGHIEVAAKVDRRLLHRAQSEKVTLAGIHGDLVCQEAVCVDLGIDGDVAFYSADTTDVETKLAIVRSEQHVKQVGTEAAVLLTLGQRL
jgi:hypothetical protein